MKRIRLWLRELTLTQQLVTIVFLVISFFALFVFSILSPQINSFAGNEMYRMLHNSQYTVSYYLNQYPSSSLPDNQSSSIQQLIYDPVTDSFLNSDLQDGGFLDGVRENILDGVKDTEDDLYSVSSGRFSDVDIYYCITQLNDGRYLVSLVPNSYEGQFRSKLVNNVVNLNIMVAAVLLMILTIWVASIIVPLYQIKTYINRIKNDEPAELNIDRRDEIGDVANALRDMQAELARQNKEKQEMIQNISHDLKTPIATIRSYGESIKDGIYPYGTLEQSVDVIIEHADRLDKKVRSLIALNKMDYLLDSCEPGDHLNMSQVIDKAILSLKVVRPEIRIETDVDKTVCFHGEEEPWRIVVENLMDNALRYAKALIKIELKPGQLVVFDDGQLLDEDRMKKLFHPYEKGTDGQFGLGLSIVYRVCTTYGYHVSAENRTDGVAFRIWKDLDKKELRAIEREKKKQAQGN